jgi:hypothetical protein
VNLRANSWSLLLGGKLDGSGPHYVCAGQDFAACTGIFFYRGKRLESGLESLLEEFDGRNFPWHECRGHYAVTIFKGGRLWLASDEVGAYKIYRDLEGSTFSSSFTALRAALHDAVPDVQGMYEYAFNGATFGDKTLLRHVKQQRQGILYCLSEAGPAVERGAPLREALTRHASIDEAAEDYAERLRRLFRVYTTGNQRFRAALSAGYDSRLILALLLDAGVEPELYVYGRDDEEDVRVAKDIAAGEGLRLEQIDKDELQRTQRSSMELAWTRFDGWNVAGLFDNGVDDEDRAKRVVRGVDILNGSGGECFRNFFYLPDGWYRPEEIVWSFYSRYDPAQVTCRFSKARYVGELVEDMRHALGRDSGSRKLDRTQVEALYPLFRVRYWTGRDVGLNQRFGPLLFPFVEPAVFAGTECLPIQMKNYGRLEARILSRVSPRLASYMSGYGFRLSEDPPFKYRLKTALTLWRPTYLRQFTYAVKSRILSGNDIPQWFFGGLEEAHLDPKLPAMAEYFRIGEIRDLDVLNRVATAELVLAGGPWPRSFDTAESGARAGPLRPELRAAAAGQGRPGD